MKLCQDPSGIQTVGILLFGRLSADVFFRIHTLNKALYGIHTLIADTELHWLSHGNAKRCDFAHLVILPLSALKPSRRRDSEQIFAAVSSGDAVFLVTRPAFFNRPPTDNPLICAHFQLLLSFFAIISRRISLCKSAYNPIDRIWIVMQPEEKDLCCMQKRFAFLCIPEVRDSSR